MTLTVRAATLEDADLIREITVSAFEEYRETEAPSSALLETADIVRSQIAEGKQIFLCMMDDKVVGSIRCAMDDGLLFSRLAVLPEYQGNGIAKAMLAWLEKYAAKKGVQRLWCKVRKAVSRNVHLYESVGFHICLEETFTRASDVQFQVVTMEKMIQLTNVDKT